MEKDMPTPAIDDNAIDELTDTITRNIRDDVVFDEFTERSMREKIKKIPLDHTRAHLLGLLAFSMRDPVQGASYFESALQMAPTDGAIWGNYLRAVGHTSGVAAALSIGCRSAKVLQIPTILKEAAFLSQKIGDFERSLGYWDRYLKLIVNQPEVFGLEANMKIITRQYQLLKKYEKIAFVKDLGLMMFDILTSRQQMSATSFLHCSSGGGESGFLFEILIPDISSENLFELNTKLLDQQVENGFLDVMVSGMFLERPERGAHVGNAA